jgi:16S rRNA (guanine527-N7)-methyltransferase
LNGLLAQGLEALAGADPDTARVLTPRFDRIVTLLDRYMDEIETFNPAYGLVKAGSREELIVRHILDSLAPLGHIVRLMDAAAGAAGVSVPYRAADAGSGAGLPGVPLAVCLDGAEFSLIERMGRRAGFLLNAAAVLGLANVIVEETELEQAEGGRFNLVVFRALSPLSPAAVKSLFRLLADGGVAAAYKGRRDTAARELAAAGFGTVSGGRGAAVNGGTAELIPLNVPFLDEERYLALMRPAR